MMKSRAAKTIARFGHRRLHTGNLPVELLQQSGIKCLACRVRSDLTDVRTNVGN